MNRLIRNLCSTALLAIVTIGTVHAAPVTQSLSGLSGSICCGDWSTHTYGSISLAQGTSDISNLQSTVTVWDQGWGGEVASWTQVFLGLYDNGVALWTSFVAGGTHSSYDPQYFTADASQLAALDAALAGIDWSSTPNVTVQLNGNIQAYSGWAEYVSNSSFTVTSDVPEPATLGLLGLGLAGLGFSRRRKQKLAA